VWHAQGVEVGYPGIELVNGGAQGERVGASHGLGALGVVTQTNL